MLFQCQGHQNAQQRRAKAQHAVAEFLRILPEAPGQTRKQQNHCKFCNLGGLKLDAGKVDPASGAVDLLPDHQHTQQQHNTGSVQRPCQMVPELRREPAEQIHTHKSDSRTHRLLLQIAGRDPVVRIILALGIACRIQHRKSNAQKQKNQNQERDVHTCAAVNAAVLFGNRRMLRCHKRTPSL